jgi:SpoVK/Ycf46/Vps4 family AAA+-type ATPase
VPRPSLSLPELFEAARGQCGTELASLAPQIEVHYKWDDLILPPDVKAQLREICSQAESRSVVYGKWVFDRKLSLGKGLNVLFSGSPGTGKTMGAEVIAHELGLDLYRIDLSQVVSKYIGETEKNLDRIFTAAEDSNAILFFDEADALFGKRSEVRDAHDRYANIEISYLLQKMEEYQGISFLATNLRQNIDDAFVRRLQAIVEFPFPDEEYRRRIWENVFPAEAPRGEDVQFELLAREVRLAGGNIKNMALAASFYAAAEGGEIHLSHLIHAAYREHQKLARSWTPSELLQSSAQRSASECNSEPGREVHT